MGRGGWGVFDSDSAWDTACELDYIVGISLTLAGYVPRQGEKDDVHEISSVPILSIKDTAEHLSDCGHFDRVFELLKARGPREHYLLILFVLHSMQVGAKISKRHLKHVKSFYKDMPDWDYLPECKAQIKYALKEYKDEPYELRNFVPDDESLLSWGEFVPKGCDSEDSEDEIKDTEKSASADSPKAQKKRCRQLEDDIAGDVSRDEHNGKPKNSLAGCAEHAGKDDQVAKAAKNKNSCESNADEGEKAEELVVKKVKVDEAAAATE